MRDQKNMAGRKRRPPLLQAAAAMIVVALAAGLFHEAAVSRSRGKAEDCVAALQAGRNVGSCVLYEDRPDVYVFLTAAHVLGDAQEVFITFAGGSVTGGTVLTLSEEEDVAAVLVQKDEVPAKLQKKLTPCLREKWAYDALEQGTPVTCRGAKTDGSALVYEGTVGDRWRYASDFDLSMLYLYCRADAGMSGGAALDDKGRFLGLILGGNGSETVCLPLPAVENWAARLF